MQSRKLSLFSLAIAAIAFAFTMDAHAATLAAVVAIDHADALSLILHEQGAGIAGAAGIGAVAIGSTASSGAITLAKSKMFRIAVEGATTDGRTIERAWLEQIAANYSVTKYGARVNLEHYRGILPDGPFKAYGDVVAVETRELDGEFAGKLGLYAQIEPTRDLIALTKAKQKIYTSCEINPDFAESKEAYLIGLAVTDSPASLGTEILSFAAQNPAASPFASRKISPTNLFTAASATVIEFEEPTPPAALPALLSRVKDLLTGAKKKEANDETRFTDVGQAVETLATHGKQQADALVALTKTVSDLVAQRDADRSAFDELHTQLSTTSTTPVRPPATGAPAAVVTDC